MRIFLWTLALAVTGFLLGAPVGSGLFLELNFGRGIAWAVAAACVGFAIGKLLQKVSIQKKLN
jgi:hypothetical protein